MHPHVLDVWRWARVDDEFLVDSLYHAGSLWIITNIKHLRNQFVMKKRRTGYRLLLFSGQCDAMNTLSDGQHTWNIVQTRNKFIKTFKTVNSNLIDTNIVKYDMVILNLKNVSHIIRHVGQSRKETFANWLHITGRMLCSQRELNFWEVNLLYGRLFDLDHCCSSEDFMLFQITARLPYLVVLLDPHFCGSIVVPNIGFSSFLIVVQIDEDPLSCIGSDVHDLLLLLILFLWRNNCGQGFSNLVCLFFF